MTRDYFGRREPSVKTHIDRDEFTAIKRFTIKTATSKFNIDLASNKSVSLFEEGPYESIPDQDERVITDTPDIMVSKDFSESRVMEKDKIDEFMKTASNFGQKEDKLDEINEREEGDMDNLEGIEEMNDLKNKIPKWKDVHDKDNIIVFRNFVEMILTTA